MTERLTRWFIFSVLVALKPLIASWLPKATQGGNPTISSLLSHGELLLISVAISAAATGDLLGTDQTRKLTKIILGGLSIILMLIAALYFSGISSSQSQANVNPDTIRNVSIFIYVSAVIIGGCCKAFSEA